MMILRILAVALALFTFGCKAKGWNGSYQSRIDSRPVELYPAKPDKLTAGVLTYAGGVEILALDSSRFGGLSALSLSQQGSELWAYSVGDQGLAVRWRLQFDDLNHFIGVDQAKMSFMREGEHILNNKTDADAEGLSLDPNGRAYVAFERRHRILRFDDLLAQQPAQESLALPDEVLAAPANEGLEALAWLDQSLAMGLEDGRIWLCPHGAPPCRLVIARGAPLIGYRLTDLTGTPDGKGLLALYRAYDPLRGWRALVAHITLGNQPKIAILTRLAHPMSVDNFEGIASIATDKGWRIFLLSDDNFSDKQRTLMMAFDWANQPVAPISHGR